MVRSRRRLPPLEPLKGFVASARALSFTRAAVSLHLTQSAVSRQVQTMEQALGVALFERGVLELRLTADGHRLFAAAAYWLDQYARLADDFARHQSRRPITVTASIGIAALWLVPRLSGFQSANPGIDVRIAAGNRIVDLASEGIDVAIRYCRDRDAPGGAERLFGESVVPVASPALGVRRIDRETLPELALLEFDDPRYPWLRWDDWLAAMGLEQVAPATRLSFSHYDQLIQAAVAGQGVAIGRAELVDRMTRGGQLEILGSSLRQVEGRGFWLILPGPPRRQEVDRFAVWVRSEARAAVASAAAFGLSPGPAGDHCNGG